MRTVSAVLPVMRTRRKSGYPAEREEKAGGGPPAIIPGTRPVRRRVNSFFGDFPLFYRPLLSITLTLKRTSPASSSQKARKTFLASKMSLAEGVINAFSYIVEPPIESIDEKMDVQSARMCVSQPSLHVSCP